MVDHVEGEVEEVKPAEGEVKTPDENAESQEPQYTELEEQAIAQGWDPEFDGPNKRSAREFLDRGELLTKIKVQSAELRKVQDMVGHLSEHNKQVYMAGYKKAIQELRQARAVAIEAGNGKDLAVIEDRLDATKDELRKIEGMQVGPPQQQGPTQAFQDFVARSNWYKDSASKRFWAHGMASEFAKVNPDATEEDVYKFIDKEVRKEFPALFRRLGPPSPDGEGRQPEGKAKNTGSGAFDKLMASLPEDQARVAKEMVKRNVLTKEKYVEDYEKIGRQ